MSRRCVVEGCGSRDRMGVQLFTFQRPEGIRNIWLAAIGKQKQKIPSTWRICSTHFAPDSWELNRKDGSKRLKGNAIPTLCMPSRENDNVLCAKQTSQQRNGEQSAGGRKRSPFGEVTNVVQSLDQPAADTPHSTHICPVEPVPSVMEDRNAVDVHMAEILLSLWQGPKENPLKRSQYVVTNEGSEHPYSNAVGNTSKISFASKEGIGSLCSAPIQAIQDCRASAESVYNERRMLLAAVNSQREQVFSRIASNANNPVSVIEDVSAASGPIILPVHSTQKVADATEPIIPTRSEFYDSVTCDHSYCEVAVGAGNSISTKKVGTGCVRTAQTQKADYRKSAKSFQDDSGILNSTFNWEIDQAFSQLVSDAVNDDSVSEVLDVGRASSPTSPPAHGTQEPADATSSILVIPNVPECHDSVQGDHSYSQPAGDKWEPTFADMVDSPSLEGIFMSEHLSPIPSRTSSSSNAENAVREGGLPEILGAVQRFAQKKTTSLTYLESLTCDQLIALVQERDKEVFEGRETIRKFRSQTTAFYRSYCQMRRNNALYRKKIKRLSESSIHRLVNLRSRLKDDQVSALCRKSTRGMKWKAETIRDALVFRMKMGTKAYSEFVQKVPIYPSARTLRRDVEHMDFKCGILHDVLLSVKSEVAEMPRAHRICVIGMDEMAIQEAEVYDPGTKKMIGQATFGPHTGLAKKALALVVAGVAKRYKFTAAYHFTSCVGERKKRKLNEENKNVVGEALKELVMELVIAVEGTGLFVEAFLSDMGPDNMALWAALDIGCASGDKTVRCSIPHPCRPGDRLWFLPDTVHLFKNIANSLSSNRVFILSDDVVQSEGLKSNHVKLGDLQDLLDFEGSFELKAAYQLKQENIDCKKQFSKMKVSNPCAIFCKKTEAALRAKANLAGDTSSDATIYFIALVTSWFALVSNRGGKLALRLKNMEEYNKALQILQTTANVFKTMKVGTRGNQWKPIQRGMLISCQALLEIQAHLLGHNLLEYVLFGRFTQDFVENLFSLVRFRLAIPNALHFKANLKVITLAQICLTATNTSYFRDSDTDDRLATDFLSLTKEIAAQRNEVKSVEQLLEGASIHVPEFTDDDMDRIDGWEWFVIYDMAGSVIRSLQKMNMTVCQKCVNSLLWHEEHRHPCSVLLELREFKSGVMYAVSDMCFKATMKSELTFREMRDTLKRVEHVDVVQFLVENTKYVWDQAQVPDCHDITTKYLKRYYTMRFRSYGLQIRKVLKENPKQHFGSKTMAMHTSVA